MAKVILNGKETDFPSGETIPGFLQSGTLGTKKLIFEWIGRILTEKDPLESFKLNDGDTIHLFSMTGVGL